MGFRSTFVTETYQGEWPGWFTEKYKDTINFDECLSSKIEATTYWTWEDLPADIQKAINWEHCESWTLVWLHECGGVSRVHVYKDQISIDEPEGNYVEVDAPTHGDQCGRPCVIGSWWIPNSKAKEETL